MVTAEGLLRRKSGVLYSIDPDEPVLEAIQLMADHSIGAVLVMKGTELRGIVSERDYARKVVLLRALLERHARLADHEFAGDHRRRRRSRSTTACAS